MTGEQCSPLIDKVKSSGATGRVAFVLIVKLPLAACVELVEWRPK
jgi:hypothetical protein